MKKKKIVDVLKDYWWIITTIGGAVIAFFITLIQIYDTIKTTQQMALKSVIWNKEIPIVERTSACDIYLNAGYNSLTKKECQIIVDKGTDNGTFVA